MIKYVEKTKAYYQSIKAKAFDDIGQYLHADISFNTPLISLNGKEDVLGAACGFSQELANLEIKCIAGTSNEVLMAYYVTFKGADKPIHAGAWFQFEDDLMKRIELFYNAADIQQNTLNNITAAE